MNTPEQFATMQTQKLFLCLFATQRDLDRLDARRREIMAEINARFPNARSTPQPSAPPTTP